MRATLDCKEARLPAIGQHVSCVLVCVERRNQTHAAPVLYRHLRFDAANVEGRREQAELVTPLSEIQQLRTSRILFTAASIRRRGFQGCIGPESGSGFQSLKGVFLFLAKRWAGVMGALTAPSDTDERARGRTEGPRESFFRCQNQKPTLRRL